MKRWVSKKYQMDAEKIANRYQISEIVAEVLVKRGLFDWDAMDGYLFPDMEKLHDVKQMKDAVRLIEILEQKIKQKKRIQIIGDYDVDGVMASYILYRGIRTMGGKACCRIPHRIQDGYGIREYMVTEAYRAGVDTILTCDNGISAGVAVEKAKELGMTILITDHHEAPKEEGHEKLPDADAVVDPKQSACQYPFKNLCGAGIAYKLIACLLRRNGMEPQEELLACAAIATVCDVVPLLGENRIIVTYGLKCLENCSNEGLRALIQGLQLQNKISSYDLGFRIGPCINAAGRLDEAKKGFELLTEVDAGMAQKKAYELIQLNEERKVYTAKAVKKAIASIESEGILHDKVFVLYLKECPESVAGIVAGRIREQYYRPVLILTNGKEGLKGSARSIPEYHIQKELNQCQDLLTEYGGHAMAAGFSLPKRNLEAFRKRLNGNCQLSEEALVETIYFDKEAALGEMTEDIVRQLDCMEPYGEGNDQAVFARREVEIVSAVLCGKENQVARVQLKDGMRLYSGVDFQCEEHLGAGICGRYGEKAWEDIKNARGTDYKVDILYKPSMNQKYGGVQFQIVDCR